MLVALAEMLEESVQKINVDIHSMRRWQRECGAREEAQLIGRSPGRLRIGTPHVSIERDGPC